MSDTPSRDYQIDLLAACLTIGPMLDGASKDQMLSILTRVEAYHSYLAINKLEFYLRAEQLAAPDWANIKHSYP